MRIVVAPHPDDELIGCFLMIKRGLVDGVAYADLSNEAEWKAAVSLCEDLGLEFYTVDEFLRDRPPLRVLFLPSPKERHPLHKRCYYLFSDYPCWVKVTYVTEMSEGVILLPPDLREEKRGMLDRYYPMKSDLWLYEHKYFLFEGYTVEGEDALCLLQRLL